MDPENSMEACQTDCDIYLYICFKLLNLIFYVQTFWHHDVLIVILMMILMEQINLEEIEYLRPVVQNFVSLTSSRPQNVK